MSSISENSFSENCEAAGEQVYAFRGSLQKASLSSEITATKDCLVKLKEASLPLTVHFIFKSKKYDTTK